MFSSVGRRELLEEPAAAAMRHKEAAMATMYGKTVRAFLETEHIPFKEAHHPRTVSSQRLAQQEHETGWRVAKPVMLKLGTRVVMAVVPAPTQVDLSKVRMALGRDDVTLATEEEFAPLFPDCEVGAEPAIGKAYGVPNFLDRSLLLDPYLVFRDGSHEGTLSLTQQDYLRATQPVEIDMSWLPPTPSKRDPMLEDITSS
jgi:Ala-tRNA(Pro) deacylase